MKGAPKLEFTGLKLFDRVIISIDIIEMSSVCKIYFILNVQDYKKK